VNFPASLLPRRRHPDNEQRIATRSLRRKMARSPADRVAGVHVFSSQEGAETIPKPLYAQGADPQCYARSVQDAGKLGAARSGAEIRRGHQGPGRSQRRKGHLGVRPLRATECTNSTLAPMEKFDSSGKFHKAIGADRFAVPHGFYVDREGGVWGRCLGG